MIVVSLQLAELHICLLFGNWIARLDCTCTKKLSVQTLIGRRICWARTQERGACLLSGFTPLYHIFGGLLVIYTWMLCLQRRQTIFDCLTEELCEDRVSVKSNWIVLIS